MSTKTSSYALGFGLAGSGLGAAIALAVLRSMHSAWENLEDLHALEIMYGSILVGSFAGAILGMLIGIRYGRTSS